MILSQSSLKQKIARYTPIDHIRVFSYDLYANRIVVVLLPGDWRYEMIERWEATEPLVRGI